MALRRTNEALLNRMKHVSISDGKNDCGDDDVDSIKKLTLLSKSKAPAIKKPPMRKSVASPPSLTNITTANTTATANAKTPASSSMSRQPTPRTVTPPEKPRSPIHAKSLTSKWYTELQDEVETPLHLNPASSQRISRCLWHSVANSTWDTTHASDTAYDQSLLPGFLQDQLGANDDDADAFFAEPSDSYRNTPYGLSYVKPPPSRTMAAAAASTKTMTTNFTNRNKSPPVLESLGPLRRRQQKTKDPKVTVAVEADSVDFIPEPPRLPYATVARHGVPHLPLRLADLPYIPTLSSLSTKGTHDAKGKAEGSDTDMVVNYEKLIRDAAQKRQPVTAEEYLRQMIIEFYAGASPQVPNGCCYNAVLHAYAVKGDPEQAQAVLQLMWQDYERGNDQAMPNQRCYTSIMYAWQKGKNKYHAPEACEAILREMDQLYSSGKAPQCKPDAFAFTCILHCWADSHRKDAVVRAYTLFRHMLDRHDKGETDLLPDNVCYSNLINVYVNTDTKDFGLIAKAHDLFWEMVNSYFNGNDKAAPTTRNFNTILAAFSKSHSDEAAPYADTMVHKWEKFFQDGLVRAKPDAYTYSLLLKCWASSPCQNAMTMLQSTVKHLRQLQQSNDSDARLDSIKYCTVIMALARNNHASEAHEVLMDMTNVYQNDLSQDLKPDIKVYHAVLSAWSRHGAAPDHAANQASDILARLWSLSKHDRSMQPTTYTYNNVLFSFKSAKQAWRAQALLEEMKDRAKQRRLNPPDVTTYRVVLETWHRSSDAAKKSQIRLLTREYTVRFGGSPPAFRK